jgi:hypothetical protein
VPCGGGMFDVKAELIKALKYRGFLQIDV